MGWLIETVVDAIWEEWALQVYKRHGLFWAIAALIGPIVLLVLLVAAVIRFSQPG